MNVSALAALCAFLVAARPAVSADGPNSLDLDEADIRNQAYEIISAAQARYACTLEEHSMQGIGHEPAVRYVFHVRTNGAECRAALVFATGLAAREDRILFRQLQRESTVPADPASPDFRESRTGPVLIQDDQVLIHEVNPDLDEAAPPEE